MARKKQTAASSVPFSVPPVREFNDRGTLWLLEDPRNVRDLVRMQAPHLVDLLDWDKAQRVNRSFIPADLQKRESDLLFRVPLVSRSEETVVRVLWIYVLLEHQSKPDDLMLLRLLEYMLELWKQLRREWERNNVGIEGRRLMPVIPFVLYTGEDNWSYSWDFADLFDVPAALRGFVPSWDTLFLDVRKTDPATLTGFVNAIGWAMRALQAEKTPYAEIEQTLREAMAGLEGLSDEQHGMWFQVMWYLLQLVTQRRSDTHGERLAHVILEQAQQSKFYEQEEVWTMYTLVDRWLDEGRAKGEITGKQQGLRSALETVLTEKFGALPEAAQAALNAASLDTLNDWLKAFIHADSLQDMGILPESGSNEH